MDERMRGREDAEVRECDLVLVQGTEYSRIFSVFLVFCGECWVFLIGTCLRLCRKHVRGSCLVWLVREGFPVEILVIGRLGFAGHQSNLEP